PLGSIALRMNIFSAVVSSLAGLFFFLTIRDRFSSPLSALIPTSFLGLSSTIWSVSNQTEVYALTYLLIAIDLFLYHKRRYHLLAYFLGLTLTNHMIGLSVVVPIIGFLLIRRRLSLSMIILFLLPLTLYLYLLIRARTSPLLNWGNPETLERLIWHLTGKQYRVWMFDLPFTQVVNNLRLALERLSREFFFFLIPVAIYGLIQIREDLPLYLAICAINIFYSINYSIPDIESYFIPSLVVITIFLGYGLNRIRFKYLPLLALLPLIHLPQNSGKDYHFADDLAQNILTNMKNRSLLVCNIWDAYSPLLYYDIVEEKGSEHWIIDKELLRRSWYLNYLKRRYPELCDRLKDEFQRYEEQLYLFEHDLPYDPDLIQTRFERLIQGIFRASLSDRTAYLLSPIRDQDLARSLTGMTRRPEGILLRIGAEAEAFDFNQFIIRIPKKLDPRHHFLVKSIYLRMAYLNYQNYRSESALRFYQKLKMRLR
ncbi:MAG TPA: DUF2723 domain-containing protein, partial [bacterium (Candidatus Stahlbacteria)]|nr:DUF2723 domain-containing protein [Candidatus Stahlbacteria bacterium]